MSERIVLGTLVGFQIGDLPDHGIAWAGVKLVFAVGLLALLLYGYRRRLRIWSLSIPGVGTIIRPGRDGFADLATLKRRDYLRVWALPFGYALTRCRCRGLEW